MKKETRCVKIGKVQAGIFGLLLIFGLTVPSYSFIDKSVFKTDSLEVTGVSGENNVQFAFGRYIITAPFAPSKAITAETTLKDLDNNKLLILDSKKISNDPYVVDLGDFYYATRVFFDAQTQMVFIRGTQIVENKSGGYESHAVIKYLHLNLLF